MSPKKLLGFALCFLSWTLAVAQVPHLLTYQGRVTVLGRPFDGTGQFKFALVSTNGLVVFWNHDGTAGREPAAALSLPVSNGLFTVCLGDETVANMVALPGAGWPWDPIALRIWFNDGTNGFQCLSPDQRLGAVPYALVAETVPDASITMTKLAADLRNAVAVPGVTAASVVVMSAEAQATNLLEAGWIRLPGLPLVRQEWPLDYVRTSFPFSSQPGEMTNFYAGGQMWFWRWNFPGAPGQGVRFDPVQNIWRSLSTNGAPSLAASNAFAAWTGSELLVLGCGSGGWAGARYQPTADTWAPMEFAGAPQVASSVAYHWTGNQLLVLGEVAGALGGGRYDPSDGHWLPVASSGAPPAGMADVRLFPFGESLLVLRNVGGLVGGACYSAASNAWRSLSPPGGLAWPSNFFGAWTGDEWLLLPEAAEGTGGIRYRPASDTWGTISSSGAPRANAESHLIWTGNELAVLNFVMTPGVAVSARYQPASNQWQSMSAYGPAMFQPPYPEIFFTGTEFLMLQSRDPGIWHKYNLAADRWSPLDGPGLSWDSIVQWAGTRLIAISFPLGSPVMVRQYTPAAPLYLYQKP